MQPWLLQVNWFYWWKASVINFVPFQQELNPGYVAFSCMTTVFLKHLLLIGCSGLKTQYGLRNKPQAKPWWNSRMVCCSLSSHTKVSAQGTYLTRWPTTESSNFSELMSQHVVYCYVHLPGDSTWNAMCRVQYTWTQPNAIKILMMHPLVPIVQIRHHPNNFCNISRIIHCPNWYLTPSNCLVTACMLPMSKVVKWTGIIRHPCCPKPLLLFEIICKDTNLLHVNLCQQLQNLESIIIMSTIMNLWSKVTARQSYSCQLILHAACHDWSH